MAEFKPCWSFCTVHCKLRENNGCRSSIPRHDLPPPNEGVDHVTYLRWGRDDYEDHPVKLDWQVKHRRWIDGGKKDQPPVHWRKLVRDQWAGIYIWEDPEHEPTVECGYKRRMLYDPFRLQDVLLAAPRMIKAVHAAIEEDCDIVSQRRVQREILSVLRNEFKQDWLSTGNLEADWPRTFRFIESAADLLAGLLLLNYELFPHEWAVNVIKYGEPSAKWQGYLDKVASRHAKPKLQYISKTPTVPVASGGLVEEEETVIIKGLTFDE